MGVTWRRLAQSVSAAALDRVRRGREVLWTPGFMGFGNLLLVAEACHWRTLHDDPCWFLQTAALQPWLPEFPRLSTYALARDEVSFFDRRTMPWSRASQAAYEPEEHWAPRNLEALDRFVRDILLPDSPYEGGKLLDRDPNHLVVNVRRGDYYSVPEIRAEYGFAVERYLVHAVGESVKIDGQPSQITVVSDDPDWCRDHLAWLENVAPIVWCPPGGPISDFRIIAGSRRVVMTNSTFSNWAAHVGNALRADNHAAIWAPRFFDRSRNGGRSWLVDERWSVVEQIPGGWDEP